MSDKNTDIVEKACSWLPENIISLVSELAWPLVVLLLGYKFKSSISEAIKNFFNKNEVTEVSAGATGLTAKFKTAQQAAKTDDDSAAPSAELPAGMDYDSIVAKHAEQESEYSNELYQSIRQHTDALGINDAQKIDLLSKDLSLLKALNIFNIINKVLFRSQFDLFNLMPQDGSVMNTVNVQNYFDSLPSKPDMDQDGWDLIKYLAYPMSSGLIATDP